METYFIGETITVEFDKEPLFSKKPSCPNRIIWGEEMLSIVNLLEEWRDYGRRGRMKTNMRPENIKKAAKRGSWGVGRYYFRVQLENGRLFDIYYDRAPKGTGQRGGSWSLYQELFLGGWGFEMRN